MKRCSYCRQTLPLSAFFKRAASKDGLSYKCRTCATTYWHETHTRSRVVGHTMVTLICEYCKKEFVKPRCRSHNKGVYQKTCSNKCSQALLHPPLRREEMIERLERYTMPEPMSGCWLWFGNVDLDGYGKISINKHTWLAHRLSWHVYRGEIPAKQLLCHKCDNPPCVNPDHLFLGSVKDNALDMVRKGRWKNQYRAGYAHV